MCGSSPDPVLQDHSASALLNLMQPGVASVGIDALGEGHARWIKESMEAFFAAVQARGQMAASADAASVASASLPLQHLPAKL